MPKIFFWQILIQKYPLNLGSTALCYILLQYLLWLIAVALYNFCQVCCHIHHHYCIVISIDENLSKYIKSSMYSVKKRQHWTLYKTRYYKLWKKTQSKHKPTLHISTTFVIYLHQTIIQTNLGQTVSRSECEILP